MSSNTSFAVVVPDIEDLYDSDLDLLIDHWPLWFQYALRWHTDPTDGRFLYRCTVCGSLEELNLTAVLYGVKDVYLRLIPRYTANLVAAYALVKAIRERGRNTRRSFVWSLAALLADQGYPLSALYALTPRIIAVAVLQAIGVVDQAGYIRERDEVSR